MKTVELFVVRAALVLSAGFAPSLSQAQTTVPYTWKNVNIQGGGFVSGIIYSPAQQDLLYARTDVGGAYRWEASNRTWVPITDFISRDDSNYQGIRSIAPDPSDPNRVYLAAGTYTQSWAGTAAILASNDKGATWTQSNLTIKLGGNENGRGAGEPLQVDPNLGTTLYLGSSTDGLWRSTDRAVTWSKVTSFPVASTPVGTNGISFVLFDKSSSSAGTATQTIYVGVMRIGAENLYKSTDGGTTWAAVAGAPTALMAHHAALDAAGTLYLAYANGPGPNDVTAGDVMKYVPTTGVWTSIKPTLAANQTQGGYGGISLDLQKPGTILVSTIDRWGPGDDIFRTTDGGTTWKPIINWRTTAKANLDHSLSPSNATSDPHWIADVDVDPFRSDNAWFVTGYGAFSSRNVTAADQPTPTNVNWKFDNQGLEELVPLGLICPPTGAPLISVVGDIDGYRHPNPDVVPTSRLTPQYGSNLAIDFAELQPSFIVRTHTSATGKYGAYSTDAGATFTPFATFPTGAGSGGAVAVSADGSRIVWEPSPAGGQKTGVYYSTDRGTTWTASTGITASSVGSSLRPVADRVNPLKFYVYDSMNGRVLVSTDGAATFTLAATGFINTPDYIVGDASIGAVFGKEGELWLTCPGAYRNDPNAGFYHSTNSGASFQRVASATAAVAVGFGKPATTAGYPAVYIVGSVNRTYGFYRSDDAGATWKRINDQQHQYGFVGIIAGDRQTYGRVYLATGGRGIVYGSDPSVTLATQSQAVASGHQINVYPNPTSGEFIQVALSSFKTNTMLALKVLTLTGKTVYKGSVAAPAATGSLRIPQRLKAGVYLLQAADQTSTITTRFVVQ
ncbi:T9SS type A sorting domain-containing protein [Hymenobacter sp. GOD-10R]|uniref:T9SS type A sorting domain-containing protein n=1 Tax=Hymenobacter sp. GOD-10R TaxID=3093922 RepID=UPI002D76E438|nr:T9SS type A sorting domain-containing protein [Hymenobacter sp. GOD-10R]WRQ31098.1 T9SS type A sorting domain-containing protein [Hymenobacter sp. GOD-10R]